MVFSELTFIYIFLPICLILSLCLKNTAAKNAALLVMSLLFYAWGEPVYVLLMIGTSLVCWGLGLMIKKYHSRVSLTISVVVALAPLIFFKYSGFITGIVGIKFGGPSLPIGISFYTFQIISYLVDVYRGETEVQRNPFYFMLYVSLFPQLIAGPIVRYVDVEREIHNRTVTGEGFTQGVCRFLTGLGKKVILADTMGKVFTDILQDPISGDAISELSILGAWGVVLCFTFQIYFDFSGYSDMAIGLGKMLGFNYSENFNYPYIATSIKDFWRRWHISMSTFFRDYIYIPLGGNRQHQLLNMLVVWAATGLWHGAGWNFVCWGLYFFLLLTIEKAVTKKVRLPRIISLPLTFILVMLGWVFFKFENMGQAIQVLGLMSGIGGGSNALAGPLLTAAIPALILCSICATPLPMRIKDRMFEKATESEQTVYRAIYVILMLLVCTALIVSSTYSPFLYYRF